MTDEERIQWIDNASYHLLLKKYRFAPAGDPFFMDDVGRYFLKVMKAKRAEVGDAEHTRTSKAIEWD